MNDEPEDDGDQSAPLSSLRPADRNSDRPRGRKSDTPHHRAQHRAEMGNPVVTETKKRPDQLRSARWFAPDDLRAFGHRSRTMQMGYAPEEWKDRPVIAILNTWSDALPSHMHFKSSDDAVNHAVLQSVRVTVEMPA